MAYAEVEGESIDVSRPVYFYREDGDYGALSNFSRHSVTLKGVVWPTTEHYFQVSARAGPFSSVSTNFPFCLSCSFLHRIEKFFPSSFMVSQMAKDFANGC